MAPNAWMKRLLSVILVFLMLMTGYAPAFAVDEAQDGEGTQGDTAGIEIGEQPQEEEELGVVPQQVEELYRKVGETLGIDYLYVKILHMIAGGSAVYAETLPDIYMDLTVSSLPAPLDMGGVEQIYDRVAPWAKCPDESVERPNKYYLPDALYNVAADVVAIMNSRNLADRGILQSYFDALTDEARFFVLFCEAVLQYTGSSEDCVNSMLSIYDRLVEASPTAQCVMETDGKGNYRFKEQYEQILYAYGVETEREVEILGMILRFDQTLASAANMYSVTTEYVLPYVVGETSRANMMMAAMSIVGKCRYTWGGGHLGTGRIKGINPAWKLFSDRYGTRAGEPGYTECIIPDGSWCPLHGKERDWDACLYTGLTSYSLEAYLAEREEIFAIESLDTELLSDLLTPVDFEGGVTSHRLDGLDCSGYVSWLCNQVSNGRYIYDAGALYFMSQWGVKRLSNGTKLLPGDLYSWGDHIVLVVGAVAKGSKAYVMLEAGPSNVKFGALYYTGASNAHIEQALALAREANLLLGNMDAGEKARKFNMSRLWYSGSSTSDPWRGYRAWGRLRLTFTDAETVVEPYGKTINEMTAQEIIQHTIDRMPYQYLSGIEYYEGELFNVDSVMASNRSVVAPEVDRSKIVLNLERVEESAAEEQTDSE